MSETFDNYRTPVFFIIFIGVLLVQIFWKRKAFAQEKAERESRMGPLEKTLSGKMPGGKPMNSK